MNHLQSKYTEFIFFIKQFIVFLAIKQMVYKW